jgi:hypothetical protein
MKLSDGERHSAVSIGKRHRLTINPIVTSDFGNYSCVSENALGKARGKSTQTTLTGTCGGYKSKLKTNEHFEKLHPFSPSGAPARPLIVSSLTGQHRYSYHLKWRTASPFPVLQHRIEYWPHQQHIISSSDAEATVSYDTAGERKGPKGSDEAKEKHNNAKKNRRNSTGGGKITDITMGRIG